MPFPRKLLNDGEDVVLDLHPHWWFFARQTLTFVVAVVLAVIARPIDSTPLRLILVALVLLAALAWLFRYLKWTTTNFVVTTDRLIFRSGVVSKHGREIPLERINDISFHQSIFERVIGAGDLMIESAGERGQETFNAVRKPSIVQNVIYSEVERGRQRDADRTAARPSLSIPEQIEKLDELRQRGVLTQAEFDAKKTQLLNRL